jgi:hypothetical protein
MCKAGKDFNLSFESLASHEALQHLQEVQKNDKAGWIRIATAQYKTSVEAADELELTGDAMDAVQVSTEPPFDSVNEQDMDASDVPMEVLIDHLASGGMHAMDGGLSSMNHSEIYNIGKDKADVDIEGSVLNAECGCGKHRWIANKMYNNFWTH